jgi:succinoglycan biosynthesis protein ExoL
MLARDTRAGVFSSAKSSRVAGATTKAPDAEAAKPLVAYFGPDIDDSAVRRRVTQWRHAGFRVLPFAFSRTPRAARSTAEFVRLGRIRPLSRAGRVVPLALAGLRLLFERRMLAGTQLFIGRNMDNALLALFARWITPSSAPLVYEVLDVNRSCTERGLRGALMRRLETWLLARTDLLVVSSAHFATDYYERVLGYRRSWFLFENKIPQFARLATLIRPASRASPPARRRPANAGDRWRIGWFGYLDDERSWGILRRLAERLPQQVEIYVRGMPYTNFDMVRFLADVERLGNVIYGGPYRNPEELAEVYGAVDIVWSADCNVPTGNSKWLLTNGLYEAGHFGKPVIGLVGTAIGEFLTTYGSGWCLTEPVDEALVEFIGSLTRDDYEAKRRTIAGLAAEVFVETDEISRIWTILREKRGHRPTIVSLPASLSSTG